MSGYVYFFGVDDALKVGHTVDVRKRLVTAQTMHRSTVELVAVEPGTRVDELDWHERLADYAIRGEWFALCVGSRRLLSQSAFARAIGVTPSNVTAIAKALGRPVDEVAAAVTS